MKKTFKDLEMGDPIWEIVFDFEFDIVGVYKRELRCSGKSSFSYIDATGDRRDIFCPILETNFITQGNSMYFSDRDRVLGYIEKYVSESKNHGKWWILEEHQKILYEENIW